MRSVYECGCIAGDVSAIAKCPTHEKLVACRWSVEAPVSKIWRGSNVSIVCNSLTSSIAKIEDNSVSVICTYPNQSEFYARRESDLFPMPDAFFKHYHRVLREEGIAILFVEQSVISAAIYCAQLHNFIVNSISIVSMDVGTPDCYHTLNPKFCIVLSKGKNSLTLGDFKFRETSSLFERIAAKGLILDTTCLFTPIVLNAVRTNRVIGLCYDFEIFKTLVTKLRIDYAS